jgi:hypothetical protein
MNRWIQLEENRGAVYQIKEIYPREGIVLGTLCYGEEFLYDMPTDNAAVILSLEPAPPGEKVIPAALPATGENVHIVKAFSEATGK